ncbi:MAG: hypothetical protein ACRDFQ_03495 [Anaerolineales bacterium]
MSEVEMQEQESHGPAATDVMISLLAALTVAGVVWGAGVGVVAGLNYAGEYFRIGPPPQALLAGAIQAAYTFIPILAAIGAGRFAYRFVIRLP